jgi:hypothetical protein
LPGHKLSFLFVISFFRHAIMAGGANFSPTYKIFVIIFIAASPEMSLHHQLLSLAIRKA